MNDPPQADGFVLLNDQPVSEPDAHDVLGMTEEVSGLASLIMGSRDSAPFTVGIDAGWGMGKSSLMLQLQAALDTHPGVVTSWFNAWTAEGTDALAGLVKSALQSVDENRLRRMLRRVARHRGFIAGLRATLIVVASFFHLARVVDQIWEILSVDANGRNAIRGDLQQIFGSWAAKTERTPDGHLLVIFIDDLDRCSAEVVVSLCEAVKLYLSVPGVIFVLGCDQDILAQAARAAGRLSSEGASLAYLEKVVQITYRKPAPNEDQMSQLVDYYALSSRTTRLFGDSVKQVVIQGTGRNPRRIKRLINGFILEYRLDPGWSTLGAEALVSVILLQHFYPDFYRELTRPAGPDVVHEFLAYYELRSRLQLGSEPHDIDRKFFEDHGVMPPEQGIAGNAEAVSRLEQELPFSFTALVRRPEFVRLVTALCDISDFGRLMSRLQSRTVPLYGDGQISSRLTSDTLSGDALLQRRHETERSGDSLAGQALAAAELNILLLTNDDYLARYVGGFLSAYARSRRFVLASAPPSIDSIRDYFNIATPDVIVWSIGSGGSFTNAVAVLAAMNGENRYPASAVFFADRVTPARMRQASSAKAALTDDPEQLINLLDSLAAAKARAENADDSPEAT